MSTVRRTVTTVQEQDVDDGEGFNPLVAIGIAGGAGQWRTVRDEVTFEVVEGGQVYQVAGGRGGSARPVGVVAVSDADVLGAAAAEEEV